jgi:N-methylhydantoinase A
MTTHETKQDDATYRVSVDTGGTFTDGFVSSASRSAQIKVDTTPYDPTVGFGNCIAAAAEAMGEELDAFLSKTRMVHFSSTVSTNAVVQRVGASVGLVVTQGHESDFYGTGEQAAALRAFLPNGAVRGVRERVDDSGALVEELDEASVETAVRELLETGVQIVVVSLANAHLNPANERRAKQIIDTSYPKHYLGAIPLVLSSMVSLVDDDHGRTALAVANAYVHPNLARSLYRAEDLVRRDGLTVSLQIVGTDGSTARVAKTRAIDTFSSGPAAGALGAAIVADALKAEHVVTFDVGGTTTDVALLRGGAAPRSATTEFGPALIPHHAVDIWSFGVGGGSLITVADNGSLAVGPQSAGAVPGPACFGLGGETATPTDLWLSLGYLDPHEFLSGRRQLDVQRARDAVGALANRLGVSVEEAALAANDALIATVGKEMAEWAARHPELTTSAPENRWLFSYGGGGGLLAVHAAEALDIRNVAVFPQSSVFSAFGGGLLPIAHSYESPVADIADAEAVRGEFAKLADRARRDLRAERVPADAEVRAQARVVGFRSGAGLEVPVGPLSTLGERLTDVLAGSAAAGIGKLTMSVEVARDVDLSVHTDDPGVVAGGTRRVLTTAGEVDIPIVAGLGSPDAAPARGPAFLAARDTTIFVPSGWDIEFNELGYGLLRRKNRP